MEKIVLYVVSSSPEKLHSTLHNIRYENISLYKPRAGHDF